MVFDIRRFDIYRKVPKDLTQPTTTGAAISLTCCAFILYMLASEFLRFLSVNVMSELYVDDPQSGDRIPVRIIVELPEMDCQYLGMDIQDSMGRHEVGLVENTDKVPVNDGKGCLFTSSFQISKVPGNFHLSTHGSAEQPQNPNMTHEIKELRFGDLVQLPAVTPRSLNPIDGKSTFDKHPLASHDYVLKIVPTVSRLFSTRFAQCPICLHKDRQIFVGIHPTAVIKHIVRWIYVFPVRAAITGCPCYPEIFENILKTPRTFVR